MTDADREFNGRMIEQLCALGDKVLAAHMPRPPATEECDNCGVGMVPAGSWSGVADRPCEVCGGKGKINV